MAEAASIKESIENIFCPHCDEILFFTTFYRHKKLFYKNGIWNKKEGKQLSLPLSLHEK